jgi:hypothetical protein
MMQEIIRPLRSIDWANIDAVETATRTALGLLLEDPALIGNTLATLPDRPDLLGLCEHYDILDKLVLHDDDSGVRVRLHVFLPGYFDRPHNHRWSYASTILRGEYRHHLFGDVALDERVDPASLKPLLVRRELAGNTYALHHAMVHAVVAEPYTVSLVIRGPAIKDRFLVMDRTTGNSWWQYGASNEPADESRRKRMTAERFRELAVTFGQWGLFE